MLRGYRPAASRLWRSVAPPAAAAAAATGAAAAPPTRTGRWAAGPSGAPEQAGSGTVAAVVLLTGAGAGLAGGYYALLQRKAKELSPPPEETVKAAPAVEVEEVVSSDFRYLSSTPLTATFVYRGREKRWQGTGLRLRLDSPEAGALDAAATKSLAGRLAPGVEVVHLPGETVAALLAEHVGKVGGTSEGPVVGLRVSAAPPGPEAIEGFMLLVLKPGVGLLDLYGHPGLYAVEEGSELRQDERARQGKYNPQDLFSGRVDHIRRGLAALVESPPGANAVASLEVYAGGVKLLPAGRGMTGEADTASLEASLQKLGLTSGVAGLLGVLCSQLQGEGAQLLAAVRRAQCGAAGSSIPTMVRELREVLRQHALEEAPPPEQVLEKAFARGFWNLAADSSGKQWREREGERLLERTRRELWTEGSASRRELEAEIRKFLFRYQLGRAAAQVPLRVRLAWAVPGPAAEQALRQLGFAPVPGEPRLWAQLELAILELPSGE